VHDDDGDVGGDGDDYDSDSGRVLPSLDRPSLTLGQGRDEIKTLASPFPVSRVREEVR